METHVLISRKKWRFCGLLLLLVAFISHAGQDNIRFETYSLNEGLSQENVRAIHQDSEGYMWFGTQEGLNRFDGYQFKVYANSLEDRNTLSSSFITSIAETSDGTIWLGTSNGVSSHNKQKQSFKRYRKAVNEPGKLLIDIRVVFVDSQNMVWAGTANGLYRYNQALDGFEEIVINGAGGEKDVFVDALAEDITGGLWIAATHIGLFRYDRMANSVNLIAQSFDGHSDPEPKSPGLHKLMIDSEQRLWIGTIGLGLFTLDLQQPLANDELPTFERQQQFDGLKIRALHEDQVGNTWVGTETGLYFIDKTSKKTELLQYALNDPTSIADNYITSLHQDKGGVFWVGTYRGLSKWNTATAKFDYYRVQADQNYSLTSPIINEIENAGNDQVWISTQAGLNLLDLDSKRIQQFYHDPNEPDSLAENNIQSLFSSSKTELWLGYRSSGLGRLDRTTGKFTQYKNIPGDPKSLAADGVTSVIQADEGKLWVGTFDGGLNLFDKQTGTVRRYQHNPNNLFSISGNKIMSLTKDRRGMLWIGTLGQGLNLFNPALGTSTRILKNEEQADSLGSDVIYTVYEDKLGNIWVGTGGSGLNFLSSENRKIGNYVFEKYSRMQGLPSSSVFGILEDPSGSLWLSTNRGLTKFDPETKQMLNYDSSHGLQGNEFNFGAYHKMPDGTFFFGGNNGVTAFDPDDIAPNSHVPPVVLTKFQRLNEVTTMSEARNQNDKIEVSYKDYLIAFEFAGLDYSSPGNNRYAYKLEGFDEDWIEARDVRKATYTNLPAGNYVFKVKASNNDGVWNEEGSNILLTVLPAPWFSWWAYSIYSLFFLGLSFWLYRSYLNKVKREEVYLAQLENEVQKRTMELSAANEQLLNTSVTDQLTGLHNRRYLANVIKGECESIYKEFKSYLSNNHVNANEGPRLFFLMFDLDGFKPINDTYGHDAGDRVIMQVGELLQSVCREDDIVIRWGGDEFMVVGKVYDQGEVSYLAERIRETIEKYGFNIGLSQRMHLSSSIGYAMYPFAHFSPDSLSWEQVHLLADKALYKSKDAGRNTWVGMVQCPEAPSVGVMNTLTHNVDHAVEQGHIVLETPETMRNAHKNRSNVSSLASRK
ncbi:diguanylate cyclase [Glaciecola sp. MH2013]|uniref:ligand-binding sensor domain-containing protein n=1 Tax=Glaciecola sp. MH2013 TaxID=2785524 RepID=UPI00189D6D01|nr:ligand-binding sensor domain-containing diguanylate cyclase [Glaciecola sp. MH2013]MBF7073729.1 diguanylate cyclase [Glaciecola sp. MH2013]